MQPADIFLDLAGEDLRRRLFLTTGEDGQELCLRPDFTIPIARHYLETGDAGRTAAFSYVGQVFRHRPGQLGETMQAGVESIGRTDEEQADADMLALALEACSSLGLAPHAFVWGMRACSLPFCKRLKFQRFGSVVCGMYSASGLDGSGYRAHGRV